MNRWLLYLAGQSIKGEISDLISVTNSIDLFYIFSTEMNHIATSFFWLSMSTFLLSSKSLKFRWIFLLKGVTLMWSNPIGSEAKSLASSLRSPEDDLVPD